MRKRIFVISLLVMLLATAAYVAAQDDGDKPIPSPQSDDPVERGEYLFRIGFGCMGCHRGPLPDGAISEDPLTADPTGGEPFELPFATVYASNLRGHLKS
jgi:hypothetical protein